MKPRLSFPNSNWDSTTRDHHDHYTEEVVGDESDHYHDAEEPHPEDGLQPEWSAPRRPRLGPPAFSTKGLIVQSGEMRETALRRRIESVVKALGSCSLATNAAGPAVDCLIDALEGRLPFEECVENTRAAFTTGRYGLMPLLMQFPPLAEKVISLLRLPRQCSSLTQLGFPAAMRQKTAIHGNCGIPNTSLTAAVGGAMLVFCAGVEAHLPMHLHAIMAALVKGKNPSALLARNTVQWAVFLRWHAQAQGLVAPPGPCADAARAFILHHLPASLLETLAAAARSHEVGTCSVDMLQYVTHTGRTLMHALLSLRVAPDRFHAVLLDALTLISTTCAIRQCEDAGSASHHHRHPPSEATLHMLFAAPAHEIALACLVHAAVRCGNMGCVPAEAPSVSLSLESPSPTDLTAHLTRHAEDAHFLHQLLHLLPSVLFGRPLLQSGAHTIAQTALGAHKHIQWPLSLVTTGLFSIFEAARVCVSADCSCWVCKLSRHVDVLTVQTGGGDEVSDGLKAHVLPNSTPNTSSAPVDSSGSYCGMQSLLQSALARKSSHNTTVVGGRTHAAGISRMACQQIVRLVVPLKRKGSSRTENTAPDACSGTPGAFGTLSDDLTGPVRICIDTASVCGSDDTDFAARVNIPLSQDEVHQYLYPEDSRRAHQAAHECLRNK